jgi:hypothetical protein
MATERMPTARLVDALAELIVAIVSQRTAALLQKQLVAGVPGADLDVARAAADAKREAVTILEAQIQVLKEEPEAANEEIEPATH